MEKVIPFGGDRREENYKRLLGEVSLLTDEEREKLLVPVLKDIISIAINALPELESKKKADLGFNLNIRSHVGGLIEFGKEEKLLPKDFDEKLFLVAQYAKSKKI